MKSLGSFLKAKGKQWKEKVTKKTKENENKEEDVFINIGFMEFKEKLKPVRGKRLMFKVSNRASYKDIIQLAETKFKAYHGSLNYEGEEYVLLYESGMEAQFLPGTTEFFNLARYRFETGKDYKRKVLYLCTRADFQMSETGYQSSDSNNDEPPYKRTQIEDDEVLARQLQSQWDDCVAEDMNILQEDTSTDFLTKCNFSQKFETCATLIQSLQSAVCDSNQLFVIRREASFERMLGIWKRAANKNSPENVLRVHYAGQDGIESGATVR